jgi:hypothetical protein
LRLSAPIGSTGTADVIVTATDSVTGEWAEMTIHVTVAADTPGVAENQRVSVWGGGVALKVMDSASITHRGLLDEWLALESSTSWWAEFFVDRAILGSLRGEDPTADLAEAARILVEGGDTGAAQLKSYGLLAEAWAAFAGGRPDEVRRLGEHAVELSSYFAPLACPLLARSALWAGEAAGATSALALLDASGSLGAALAADRLVARAGIDALEGRGPAALAGYREALRAYRKLGLAFDEAAAAVDMAVLLRSPERDAADVAVAIEAARDTLERLGARPFLARLDEARTRQPAG